MDVKEAVRRAKAHAVDVFEGETVRIEEVWFDDRTSEWCVTIGLQRTEPSSAMADMLGGRKGLTRTHYKTIRLTDAGDVSSVKNHEKMPVSPL
jgi:hypothetical protein